MSRKQALTELLAKVEAGEDLLSDDIWEAFSVDGGIGAHSLLVLPAFSGSLDAAKTLHEAVLPGWSWNGGSFTESMTLFPPNYEDGCYADETPETIDVYHADPARAWLIAILRALIAEEDQ